MAKSRSQSRHERYFKLSSQIAQLDTAQILSLIEQNDARRGWGRNHTLKIGSSNVFIKRLPVTDLEYDHMFSTKNLYAMPLHYNYGVGSAGFGVFRELVSHIKTTNWVLSGEIAHFPLMYHYRIVPFSGTWAEVNQEKHQRYLHYWGNSEHIGSYILARAQARHELLLCLEWVPYTMSAWLLKHPEQTQRALDDLRATIDFLRSKGIIHFDAHFGNILTDGDQAYVTDFGLVLDKHFMLTNEEVAFFKRNTHYDYGEVAWSVGALMVSWFEALGESDQRSIIERYHLGDDVQFNEAFSALINNIEDVANNGLMKLDTTYVDTIIKYRSIIMLVQDFFSDMHKNNQKDTRFPHARLRRLLKTTGLLADPRPNR